MSLVRVASMAAALVASASSAARSCPASIRANMAPHITGFTRERTVAID